MACELSNLPPYSSSKILWLSLLPASLMKIRSKLKSLLSGQHFPKSMRPSREGLMLIVESRSK